MPKQPLILLAFSNQQDAYLSNLKRESGYIERALTEGVDQGFIRLWREESAETEDLIRAFNRFDGEIAIFHYGGHAWMEGLEMEDGTGLVEGLAQLLKEQSGLKLVFLNGCSTKALVDRLLALGVPVVIGTSAAINDQKATEFAGYFYDKLASMGSIRQAYTFAFNSLFLRHKSSEKLIVEAISPNRGIALENSEKFPWGLYYNEQQAEVLDWTLPLPTIAMPKRQALQVDYEINEYLYPILEEMAKYNAKIEGDLEEMEDEREYFEMIIKNFPWNIGSQFGLLVGEKNLGIERLEQIVSTYMACGQWLYFVPLSQLWEEKSEEKIQEFKGKPHEVFTIWDENFLTFDYLKAFREIVMELTENKIPVFVAELKALTDSISKGGNLYEAYLFLESVKEQLVQRVLVEETPDLHRICLDAEYALAQLLCRLAFLVNYQMVTVREISVVNPRHLEIQYLHKIGRLNAHTDERLFFFKNPKSYDEFLESNAVLLLKGDGQIDEYLSLSPFFIDRNAYLDKNADLTDLYSYGYAKEDQQSGSLVFYYLKSSRNLISAFSNELDRISTSEEVISDIRRKGVRGLKNRPGKIKSKRPYALLKEQFDNLLEQLQ